MYDSPKTIRNRQTRKDAPRARSRQPRAPKTFTGADWDAACEFHVSRILAQSEAGHPDAAGRHAEALVHMAVIRRTLELMKIRKLPSFWEAMADAKDELLNCAGTACGHIKTGCGDACNIRDGYGVGL